jgi:hypothetical protein
MTGHRTNFLVVPIPTVTGNFDLGHKIDGHAFLQGIFNHGAELKAQATLQQQGTICTL